MQNEGIRYKITLHAPFSLKTMWSSNPSILITMSSGYKHFQRSSSATSVNFIKAKGKKEFNESRICELFRQKYNSSINMKLKSHHLFCKQQQWGQKYKENTTGIMIQFVHSTRKRGRDSLPIFPAHKITHGSLKLGQTSPPREQHA